MYEADQTTLEMANFPIEGNIIDHSWYHIIKNETGYTDSNAIILLTEIVYWYRPIYSDDSKNPKSKLHKKYQADLLQLSYPFIEKKFGFTKRQSQDAFKTLESLDIAWRELRTIEVNGAKISNVLFIRLNYKNLLNLRNKYFESTGNFKKCISSYENSYELITKNVQAHDNIRMTNTEITTKTSTEIPSSSKKTPCKGDLHPPVKEIDTPCKAALHKEEPIKKNLSKKNIIIPNPSPPVFDAPTADDDLSFSDKDKEDLNNFTPEQIAEAKKRTKENCNSPNPKTRVKYFFTTLSRLPKPKPPKLSVYDELKQYFCNGKEYKGAECFLNSEGIAFQRGNFLQDQMKIDKFWSWPRFGDMCLRFSIPFKRASS